MRIPWLVIGTFAGIWFGLSFVPNFDFRVCGPTIRHDEMVLVIFFSVVGAFFGFEVECAIADITRWWRVIGMFSGAFSGRWLGLYFNWGRSCGAGNSYDEKMVWVIFCSVVGAFLGVGVNCAIADITRWKSNRKKAKQERFG